MKVSDGRHAQGPRIREEMECVGPAVRKAEGKVDRAAVEAGRPREQG